MGSEMGERPLNELLSRDMVDIYVGSDNTRWVLHEKLLCYRSKFFRSIFRPKPNGKKEQYYGLPDEGDEPFKMFVGWLYSERIPTPRSEDELSPLLDLYLMGEKWEIKKLIVEALDAVRIFYLETDSWPSLRRVQYIYANTEVESPMRQLLVSCAARMLVTGEGIPDHWQKALKSNGELAVDLIMCVQKWKVQPDAIPEPRKDSVMPIMKEAQQQGLKVDEDEDEDNKLDWGEGLTYNQNQSQAGGDE
ncbi:unnamed protein product [Zymoseptoria tritici ST99CH_3D7]|uniref:BTB domain-containing protein n=1 Tax=Zymoseptoria tritici (strain ST99CH_3D7) TaxID=1276538 RepID=A0A1X7RKZ8_ZYMT9|nr:unnamed protein product [Zymoseptoria tritici ST99CH_3D7]